jgi:hypothetical protein
MDNKERIDTAPDFVVLHDKIDGNLVEDVESLNNSI